MTTKSASAKKAAPQALTKTASELESYLTACKQQIALSERARNEKRAELQIALVSSSDPDQLDQVRKARDELKRIDSQLELLQERRRAIEAVLPQARANDRQVEIARKRPVCDGIATKIRERVRHAESLVDELAQLCLTDVRALDEELCRSLPELPNRRLMPPLWREFPSYVLRRFQAHMSGNKGMPGTLESGYQFLQANRLQSFLEHYLATAMSGFANVESPDAPSPPEAA